MAKGGAGPGGSRGGMSIRMTENTLLKGIKTIPGAVNRIVAFSMAKNAGPAENWMKMNAPWTDRTANARNGLSARYAGSTGGVHTLVLFHQVPYGIWLEISNEGRFAVILPAVEEYGPKVMEDMVGLLDRLEAIGALT